MSGLTRRVELGGAENGVGRVQLPGVIPVRGLESIRVSMPGEARTNGDMTTESAEFSCRKCRFPLYENGRAEWVTLRDDPECVDGYDHEPVDVPLAWLNSFGVELDEEQDRIRFHVSVGDPRGAMVMELRKVDGKLFLSVPDVGESHVALHPVGDGVFEIR